MKTVHSHLETTTSSNFATFFFFWLHCVLVRGFPGGSVVKNLPANAGATEDAGSTLELGRFPWRKKWQPTPVFLPGKFHGQRSLVGYIDRGFAELDTTDGLSTDAWALDTAGRVFVDSCRIFP